MWGGVTVTFALNPDQQKAASSLDRDVFVTAGAGSGKTRMLTERFINAVLPNRVAAWIPASVDDIVAITFTEKAAGELADRVRVTLRSQGFVDEARRVDGAWVSTIHGLCSRLLRRHAFEAGVDPLFAIADTVAAGRIRGEALERAAVALLASDENVGALLDAYNYSRVFETVVAVTRELAVRGLTPGDIVIEGAAPVDQLLRSATDLFSDGTVSCREYSGTAKSPVEFSDRCAHLLGRALELGESVADEGETIAALAALVGAYKPLRRVKGLECESENSNARCSALRGEVGAAVVAPLAKGLHSLICAFSAEFATRKKAAGVLDFDDLQVGAVELLTRETALAERYRKRFRLVMIDEFQDTDALQLRLVSALSRDNLCTVGDEKQSIYRFRGADIDVYRNHRNRMREHGALEIPLGVNYRSHPEVLSFVNAVFASEEYFDGDLLRLTPPEGRPAQPLDPVLGERPRVEAVFVDSSAADSAIGRRAEAWEIARRLAALRDGGVDPGDMAILIRAYSNAHVYAEALAAAEVPAVIVGGSRFFGLEEIAIMRALTRAIANPADGSAVGELLASEFCPLSDDGLARLRLAPDGQDKRPLWNVVRDKGCALGGDDGLAAQRLVEMIDVARGDVGSRPLADVLLQAVEHAGYDIRLLSRGNVGRDAFANVLKFSRQASAFEASEGTGPAAFAAYLDTKERLGDSEAPASIADDGSRAVRIMSVHASKGLEFPVVVVPDLAASGRGGSAIARMRPDGGVLRVALSPPTGDDGSKPPESNWTTEFADAERTASEQEAERVLYVAFTRARELLIASGSMNLRPKNGSSAKHDLMKLARLLGVSVPIAGTSDMLAALADGETGQVATCRVSVLDAEEIMAEAPGELGGSSSAVRCVLAPEAGECFGSPSAGATTPARLSYSSLHLFEQCQRKFFVQDVLGLSAIEITAPGAPNPTRFGSALHAVLQLVTRDGLMPHDSRVLALARQYELDGPQRERLRVAAERFVQSDTAKRALSHERVAREMPFALPITGGECLLTGTIDLYARSGDSALIIDYKSGTSGTPDELPARYKLQAQCYALAALVDGCDSAEVVFVRPEVIDSDGAPQEVRFVFGAADAEPLRAEIDARYGQIAGSDFGAPRAADESTCRDCPAPIGLCSNASP